MKLWTLVAALMIFAGRLRKPEYTGKNRCIPCTLTNIAIAAILGTLAAVSSTIFGAIVFALSLGAIYFRGYLIPGTPKLTKRYFPERVLRWFGQDHTGSAVNRTNRVDPSQMLHNAGVLEPCLENTDLCLSADFQQAWRECIYTVRSDEANIAQFADSLNISAADNQLTTEQQDGAFMIYADGGVVGQWISRAAAISDVAAATKLSEQVPNWSEFAPTQVTRVLRSLRVFIEQCPECDGPIQVEEKVVESCCHSYDIVASVCQNCGAHVFESE